VAQGGYNEAHGMEEKDTRSRVSHSRSLKASATGGRTTRHWGLCKPLHSTKLVENEMLKIGIWAAVYLSHIVVLQ
jgi:hypothetical protein